MRAGDSTSRAVPGRGREMSRWASPSLDVQLSQVVKAGHVTGLEGLSQGVGLDIKPYGIGGFTRDIEAGDVDRERAGWRRRHLLPHHVQPDLQHDFQHRFRRNRGGCPPGQPDALPPVLPREAVLLPGGCGDLRIRRRKAGGGGRRAAKRRPDAVLLAPHRAGLGRGRKFEVPIRVGEKLTGKIGRFDLGSDGRPDRQDA